jgi:hypothetical protein
MIHRVALFVAALAAALTLAVALAAAGFGPRAVPVSAAAATGAPAVAGPAASDPTPRVVVDNVYVKPAPTPASIVVHRTVAGTAVQGGEREDGEHQGEAPEGTDD